MRKYKSHRTSNETDGGVFEGGRKLIFKDSLVKLRVVTAQHIKDRFLANTVFLNASTTP